MAFKTIHTNYGLQALTASEASGKRINLPVMAVGDGNGNPVDPQAGQTQLMRERYRTNVNRVFQDPVNPRKFSAEMIIPATVGGFTLREVGVFDDQGSLFVVGNLPDTYKPNDTEGAFSDTVVRVDFMVSNASTVEIIADPNVVIVTRDWVMNNIAAANVIPGGTTGQVATKKSNKDGDIIWTDPSVANVVVDVIDEVQTLAASQTVVTWAVVTTRGLAVYIDGKRLEKGTGAGKWIENSTNAGTQIKLGSSYPAGTRILGVQNEPAGASPFPLIRDKNLEDVPDKVKGRENLGVYSREEVDARVPPGAVLHFARDKAPPGWLKCNGAAVSRVAYAALYAAIGTTFGPGDGFTTFNVPDLRGEFIRGWDDNRGADPNRTMGSNQDAALGSHAHNATAAGAGAHTHTGSSTSAGAHSHNASTGASGDHSHYYLNIQYTGGSGAGGGNAFQNTGGYTGASGNHSHAVYMDSAGEHTHNLALGTAGSHTHTVTVEASGGAETRPRNVALLACIKF